MPEIKHNFTGGKMNKDHDERIVKNGEYRDAMNIQVSTSEDSDVGTVQNLLGNSLVSGQDFISSNATCVGSISNESEDKLYYFITNKDLLVNPKFSRDLNNNGFADYWSTGNGWSWDSQNKRHIGSSVALYNKVKQDVSQASQINLPSGTPVNVSFTLSGIDNVVSSTNGYLAVAYYNNIGEGFYINQNQFTPENKTFKFTRTIANSNMPNTAMNAFTNDANLMNLFFIQRTGNSGFNGNVENVSISYGTDMIIEHDKTTNKITPVFVDTTKSVLKFHYENLITGINIIDDMLFWTDSVNEPKKINIPRSIKGTDPSGFNHTAFLNEYSDIGVPVEEKHITVIKKQPATQPVIELEQEIDPTLTTSALTKILETQGTIPGTDGIVGPEYNFSNFEVGSVKTIRLFTDLNGNNGFTLDWQVGDILGIKSFQGNNFDQQPAVPLYNYNMKAKIIASTSNDFTDTALEVIPNFNFTTPNSANTAPSNWAYLTPTAFTYNHIDSKIQVNGSSNSADYAKWYSPSLTLVSGASYKLSMKVSNYQSGGVNIWLGTNGTLLGGSSSTSYMFRLNSDPSGANNQYINSDGVYEFNFDLTAGQATTTTSNTQSSWWTAGQNNKILLQVTGVSGSTNFATNIMDIEYISLERLDASSAQATVEILSIPIAPPLVPINNYEMNYVVSKLAQEKKIFEFKFPRIAYRYRYQDNEYSAISPFSQVAFAPSSFDYHPKKGYNLGMVNQVTAIKIKNLKSLIPDGVKEIDVVYKEDTSPNMYVVDTIKPNITALSSGIDFWDLGEYVIDSDKIYKAISSNQLLRPWDNVPKKAVAQEVIASRVVYANYTQGYDLINDFKSYYPDFNFNFTSTNVESITLPSVKTLREYQIGAVFVDKYGRETPVISSVTGGAILEKENADKQNKINVSFNNDKYPEELEYMKFFIKETSGEYYNMAMDRFYDAGDNQLWLAFPSSDINKVTIDDFLILKKGVESNVLVKDEAKFKILDIQDQAPDHIKQNKILIESLTHNTNTSLGTVRNIFNASVDELPLSGKQKFRMNYEEFTKSLSRDLHEEENGVLYIEFVDLNTSEASERYRINKIQSNVLQANTNLSTAEYIVILDRVIGDDINWATNDVTGGNSSVIKDGVTVQIYRYEVENSAKFDGKFFIKIDTNGIIGTNILNSFLGGDVNYRLKHSKRLYSLDSNITTNNRKELTGQNLGQYNDSNFGRFAPFFRNYIYSPNEFTMNEINGSSVPVGQYAFAEDQTSNNYDTYYQQTFIQDNLWKDELAYITVSRDDTPEPTYDGGGWSGYSYQGYENATLMNNARKADTHGWSKKDRENNTVWFIDKGPWKGKTKDNSNKLRFGSAFVQHDNNGTGDGIQEANNYAVFDIAMGGVLRNCNYTADPNDSSQSAIANVYAVAGQEVPFKVNHIYASKPGAPGTQTQENFWNVGSAGGNNNYNTNRTEELVNSFVPGAKFRFREDPTKEVYTISSQPETSGKIRYNSGHTGGSHWSTQSNYSDATSGNYELQPDDWLWADVLQPAAYPNLPVQFVSPTNDPDINAAWGYDHGPLDEVENAFTNPTNQTFFPSSYRSNTEKRTSQLSPNFSSNWKLECLNSNNNSTVSWNPAGSLGPIPGGLELTIAHSAYSSSGDPGAPKAEYSAAGSSCYVMVDSLQALDSNNKTKNITKGLILTAHSGTDALDNTGSNFSKQELLIWKIEEISGKFRIWLCGYRVPLCLSGTAGNASNVGFNTHDIVGNLPTSTGNLIFKQPTMNGYSQYSCNRINKQDSIEHGYNVYDTDMGLVGGVPGIMPVYYNLEFVDVISREDVLPSNPAIWETEPKENIDLDIYYEASNYNPLQLNSLTSSIVVPIGSSMSYSDSPISISAGTTVIDFRENSTGWYIQTSNSVFVGTGYIETGGLLKINKPDGSSITFTVQNYNPPVNSKTSIIYVEPQLYGPKTSYTLNWHNCFSFGNGVESNRIRDNFNLPFIAKGVKASTTLEDFSYEEENRKYGLIYSGLYNANSGINELNQFITAEKITKDLNPTYGSIQKLYSRDSDLVTLCEDKVIQILADKDAVFEADGNPQLVASNKVLGQSRPFVGEYGISKNPESFASESYRVYFSDKVRGAIIRLSKDGLTPISDAGMKDWFRDNLKLSTKIIGSHDGKKDEYNVTIYKENDDVNNIKEEESFVGTLSFKEDVRGWVSFKSFALENGLSCANDYYTLKQGKLWKHHAEGEDRNTFYNEFTNSTVNVLLNEGPDTIKSFHTLSYEGSQSKIDVYKTDIATGVSDYNYYNLTDKNGWFVSSIKTEQSQGSLNEFIEKERKWFNYIKGVKNIDQGNLIPELTDYSTFNIQGIGIVTNVEVDFVDFDVQINSSVDVGDVVYFSQLQTQGVVVDPITGVAGTVTQLLDMSNLEVAGVVSFVNGDTIQLNISTGTGGTIPSTGDYCFFVKNQIVNMVNLLGYYADVKFENNSTDKVEMFMVSSEITQSSK